RLTEIASLIPKLERFASKASLGKGQGYFRSGLVKIEHASADRVEATVRGIYTVILNLVQDEDTLVASCTCPYYGDINLCKHIWATIIAADSKGHLENIASMDDPFIETEIEYDGYVDDAELIEDDDEDFPRRSYPLNSRSPPL